MMSNRELAARAQELGGELGLEVETDGLNKAKLMAIVEELEAKAGGGPAEPEIVSDDPAKPDLLRAPDGPVDGANATQGGPPPKSVGFRAKHPLTVGPNKSVMCRRGRLNEGDEVKESDFEEPTLSRLIEIGCVVDNRE